MNNINTIDKNNYTKRSNSWKNLGYALILTGLLNVNTPTYANLNNHRNITTEQINSNANNINGIQLPSIYQNKLDNFLVNNNVMKNNNAKTFTINFVEKEMEKDRGISKENQLLFIRHCVYRQVTGQDLYDGKDGDQKIAEDFNNRGINIRIRVCEQTYRDGIIGYMNELSTDADRRISDADRRISDADRRISDADRRISDADRRISDADRRISDADRNIMQKDTLGLKEMAEFYSIYIKNPSNVKDEEIEKSKKLLKRVIPDCIKYGIDYRAILLKEVGDPQKVNAILKFYEIEN